jgi:hypothetical protein
LKKPGRIRIPDRITGFIENGELLFDQLILPAWRGLSEHNILTVLKTVDVLKKRATLSDQNMSGRAFQGWSANRFERKMAGLGRKPLTIADIGHNKDGLAKY